MDYELSVFSMAEYNFETMINSMTKAQIKEVIREYNDRFVVNGCKDEELCGWSSLKKSELIDFTLKSVDPDEKKLLFEKFSIDMGKQMIEDAVNLITGEHKTESIQNAASLGGGKGYRIWVKGRAWKHNASVMIKKDEIERFCNCRYGRKGGLCAHQMAIFLMLLVKKALKVEEIPVTIEADWFGPYFKRLEMHAAQRLFKEEPAILLEEDYNIYVNDELITLEWGGKYAGKTTKDLSKMDEDAEEWLAKKVADLVTRKIKVRAGTGEPVRILIDSYDVIGEIMEREKVAKRMLKRLKALKNETLPNDLESLEKWLRAGLKETMEEVDAEPPFDAYDGDESFAFVSYCHKDKAEVYPIIDRLHEEGFNIWYDEGIPISTEWANVIGEKLIGSAIFLSFISQHVNESENTQDEIHLALNEGKTIFSIWLEDCKLPAGIQMRLRRIQGIMRHEMKEDAFYDKLIKEMGRLFD